MFFHENYLFNYEGPLPYQAVRSAGEALRSITPQFLISSVLHGLAELSLFDSSFGSLPCGTVLSYKCPPVMTRKLDKHPDVPAFPKLHIDGKLESKLHFVPNCHQFYHFRELKGHELSAVIEEGTEEQSRVPTMEPNALAKSNSQQVSWSMSRESGVIWPGTGKPYWLRQTSQMKRVLALEPEVFKTVL